jgi:uncharacterized RDD family membrane protein YckC
MHNVTIRRSLDILLPIACTRFVIIKSSIVLVLVGLAILFALVSIPFWFNYYGNKDRVFRDIGSLPYIISGLGFLAYWTYFDSTTGQLIGKRLLKIKTTDMGGRKVDTKSTIIEGLVKLSCYQ